MKEMTLSRVLRDLWRLSAAPFSWPKSLMNLKGLEVDIESNRDLLEVWIEFEWWYWFRYDIGKHPILIICCGLLTLFGAGHVVNLRKDPKSPCDDVELVNWSLLFGKLVKSTDCIKPERFILKFLFDLKILKAVLLLQEVPLDLQIQQRGFNDHENATKVFWKSILTVYEAASWCIHSPQCKTIAPWISSWCHSPIGSWWPGETTGKLSLSSCSLSHYVIDRVFSRQSAVWTGF